MIEPDKDPLFSQGSAEKHRQRPHWSLTTNFIAAIIITAASAAVVMIVLKKPVWIELKIAVGIIGFAMLLFYIYILYHGVIFSHDETLTISFSHFDPSVFADGADPGVLFDSAAA